MPKISKAQLLRALSAAEKTRPRHASPFQTVFATPPRRLSSERAVNEIVMSAFAKAGLDRKKLKQIREQNKAELRRVIEKEKREAGKRAARAKANIKAHIAGRRQAWQARFVGPLAPPYPITLDKPFLIWATPRYNIIHDERYQSWNSWARVDVASSSTEKVVTETLSFYFMWDNPSADYPAVIDVSTSLGLWGDCQATAEGGHVSRRGALAADGAAAEGCHGFISANDLNSIALLRFVFELALAFDYSADSGHILADFQTGAWDVRCPYVEFSFWTAPAIVALTPTLLLP